MKNDRPSIYAVICLSMVLSCDGEVHENALLPVPSFTVTPSTGVAPLAVAVDASETYVANIEGNPIDPDPNTPGTFVIQYRWDFGEPGVNSVFDTPPSVGTDDSTWIQADPTANYTYLLPGTYPISLVAMSMTFPDTNFEGNATAMIEIGGYTPTVTLTANPANAYKGQSITFTAVVTLADDNGIAPPDSACAGCFAAHVQWTIDGEAFGAPPPFIDPHDPSSWTSQPLTQGWSFATPGSYEVSVNVITGFELDVLGTGLSDLSAQASISNYEVVELSKEILPEYNCRVHENLVPKTPCAHKCNYPLLQESWFTDKTGCAVDTVPIPGTVWCKTDPTVATVCTEYHTWFYSAFDDPGPRGSYLPFLCGGDCDTDTTNDLLTDLNQCLPHCPS